MTKRIIELTKGEYGFSETHATLTPIEKRYQREGDAFPQFMDVNVKQLLDSAKARGGWVMLINETPTTYSAVPVHACPVCGFPMQIIGRGATLKKHGPRYTCTERYTTKPHDARVWTPEELDNPAA